jgi:hypothetical protein
MSIVIFYGGPKMKLSVEHSSRVYNDDDGSCISISPDADGLELVEIRQIENEKIVARITMQPEQAKHVCLALKEYLNRHTTEPVD